MYPRDNTATAPSYQPPESGRESEKPLFEASIDIVRSARQRVETLAGRSGNLADRIFGSVPTGVSGSANSKGPGPSNAQAVMEVELKELHNAIEWMESQVNRLERVA